MHMHIHVITYTYFNLTGNKSVLVLIKFNHPCVLIKPATMYFEYSSNANL